MWAIQQYGFDAVIAPSFSDIFRNNCTKNGLVPVVVPEAVVERIWAAIDDDPATEITVDVERLVVEVPAIGLVEPFPMDPATQERFLRGLDDVGITLRHAGRDRRLRGHPRLAVAALTPEFRVVWGSLCDPQRRQNRTVVSRWSRGPPRRVPAGCVVVVTTASVAQAKLPVTALPPPSAPSNVPDHPPSSSDGTCRCTCVVDLLGAADLRASRRARPASRHRRCAARPRRAGCRAEPAQVDDATRTPSPVAAVERRARGVEADRVERVGRARSPGRG